MDKKSESKVKDDKANKILAESDSTTQDMTCETCNKHFTDAKTYENHMKSKSHEKMVAREIAFSKAFAKNNESDSNSDDDDDDDDDDDEIFCDVCEKRFNNYTSYMSHINGNFHAKRLKKQKLKEQMKNMPELVGEEHDENESDEIVQKPFARCATCQKSFSGPEPFSHHLNSAVHKKKVKQSKMFQVMKTKYADETKAGNEEDLFSKCKVCEKSFSGVIPYEIHMKSGAHKKELEKAKIAEEIKEFCSNDDTKEGYVCKECKKNFKDPLGFKKHLENNSHEKQKAKRVLLDLLNAYPEIVFATPLEDQGNDSDADESNFGYFLICKLCHLSFSGPESAQDHVKSKKHISIKKQKEVSKLLKQHQKKDSAAMNGQSENTVSSSSELQNKTPTTNDNTKKHETKDLSENDGLGKLDDFEMI